MVLDLGKHHLVAFAELFPAPCVGDEVYGLGRAPSEDEAGLFRRAEKAGDLPPRAFVGRCGFLREAVHPAVDVGVVLLIVLVQGFENPPRLLGGRSVVQVDKVFAAHLAPQDRELRAHFLYVIHGGFVPPTVSRGTRQEERESRGTTICRRLSTSCEDYHTRA